jgi:hypothetical protein
MQRDIKQRTKFKKLWRGERSGEALAEIGRSYINRLG